MTQTPEDPRDSSEDGRQPAPGPDYGTGGTGSGPDYGAPPPTYPSAPSPSAPPSDPYASPQGPPVPPAYGQPGGYGAPGAAPYGQPGPYGGPVPAGGPGGYGEAYGGPTELAPSKGMAITALVLSFLVCIPILPIVAIVLAIIVLVRGRDGRNHGKGLAIGALVVAPLLLIGATLAVIGIYVAAKDVTTVNDVQALECINGVKGNREVGVLRTVDCSKSHDAQVLATATLTAAEAEKVNADGDINALCTRAVSTNRAAIQYLSEQPDLEVLGIFDREEPEAGDDIACVVHSADGTKLDSFASAGGLGSGTPS